MNLTLRHRAQAILREAEWDLAPPPVVWSPRMARCAGLFVIEKDSRGKWHPEIRLSIPLLRRRDWPWPQQVCGMHCHDPEAVQQRILEHELIHFKLWMDGEKDWGHSERFRQLAWEVFGHQSITHGIGSEPDQPGARVRHDSLPVGPRSAGSPGACSATHMVATHGIGIEPE